MLAERAECIIITAQEWFKRKDFQAFRKRKGTATFRGVDPSMEDVFVTYDNGEGSDWALLPDDIWKAIDDAAKRLGVEFGVVWIRP